jgi:CRISPR-associated endoribonuclease Cas6
MRIRLSLIPTAYPAAFTTDHHHLAAFLYERLAAADPALARWLHDEGMATPGRPDKRYKPLVFGVPECPRYQFQGTNKVFHDGVIYWQIASPHEEVVAALLAGLASQETVCVGGTELQLVEAALIPQPEFQPEMRFIALSPLTAALNHPVNGKVYLREETALAQAIAANLRWKYLVLTGQSAEDAPLEFAFDQHFLRARGGLQSRQITRLVSYGATKIKAYAVPFVVRGAPALLAIGWECGFGEANAQGCGMAGMG